MLIKADKNKPVQKVDEKIKKLKTFKNL